MPETRKLLLVEVPESEAAHLTALGFVMNTWELPSAAELGRVALEASGIHFATYGLNAVDEPSRKEFIGQAILDALTKRTELRCLVTGNACGTDTWMVGHPCQCKNCQEYLEGQPVDERWPRTKRTEGG